MKHNGIYGLKGNDPVFAVVTAGIKNKNGFPVDKDMYHIVVPRASNGVRKHHPSFRPFNTADKKVRHTIRGNIVHSRMEDCFEYGLLAQCLDKKMHPNKVPACQETA